LHREPNIVDRDKVHALAGQGKLDGGTIRRIGDDELVDPEPDARPDAEHDVTAIREETQLPHPDGASAE